jgi:hypothetical protein
MTGFLKNRMEDSGASPSERSEQRFAEPPSSLCKLLTYTAQKTSPGGMLVFYSVSAHGGNERCHAVFFFLNKT